MLVKTIGGFRAKFKEMLHLGYQFKVSHKLIISVELFCHDDIFTKMLYAIRILLFCRLNYLALKLFFLYIQSHWFVFVTFLEITMTKSKCLQLKLDSRNLLFDFLSVSRCFCHFIYTL